MPPVEGGSFPSLSLHLQHDLWIHILLFPLPYRCHASSRDHLLPSSSSHHSLLSSSVETLPPAGNEKPSGAAHSYNTSPVSSSPTLPREDVLVVWAELETARDTLADIQALVLEMFGAELEEQTKNEQGNSEDYVTSAEWIKVTSKPSFSTLVVFLLSYTLLMRSRSLSKKSMLHGVLLGKDSPVAQTLCL